MAEPVTAFDEIIQLIKDSTTSKQIYNEQLVDMLNKLNSLKNQAMTSAEINSVIELVETMLQSFYNKEEINTKLNNVDTRLNSLESLSKEYEHIQLELASTWSIKHDLDILHPRVIIYNNDEEEMYAKINYIDKNNLSIIFDGIENGKVYVIR